MKLTCTDEYIQIGICLCVLLYVTKYTFDALCASVPIHLSRETKNVLYSWPKKKRIIETAHQLQKSLVTFECILVMSTVLSYHLTTYWIISKSRITLLGLIMQNNTYRLKCY